VVPATTIASTVYNGFVNDVETDLNQPRPLIAGGTGGNSAAAARTNLKTEVAFQTVTNFDSHPWENGSFVAAPGATSAPVAGHWFIGTYYGDALYSTLQARDLNGATNFDIYVRVRAGGAWTAWTIENNVAVAGDTMTGPLIVNADITGNQFKIASNSGAFGPTSASGVYADGVNVALRAYGSGNIIMQSASGGVNYAAFTSSGTQLNNTAWGAALNTIPGNGNTNVGVTADTSGLVGISHNTIQCLFLNNNTVPGWVAAFQAAGVNKGSIAVSSTATSFNTSSDGRLKEDLKSFDAGNIIDDTLVYNFAWKSTGERSYGVIAQQANEVYPNAINYNEREDAWGVDYSKYVPVILQELKALRARVAELEASVVA
jgi:hypothetical protein